MTCYNFCHPGNVAGSVYISGTTCFDGVGAFYLNNGDCICIDIDEPYQTCDNPVLAPGCQCEGDECCFQLSGSSSIGPFAPTELAYVSDNLLWASVFTQLNGQLGGQNGMVFPTCGGYTGATAVNLRCSNPFRGVTHSRQIYPLSNGKFIERNGVNISRLNADFSVDNTYNSVIVLGGNADGMSGMYVNPNGETYIMGVFGSGVQDCSGTTSNFNTNIYRIGVNGGVDTSYSGISITGLGFIGQAEPITSTETDVFGEGLVVRVESFTGNTSWSPIMKFQSNGLPDPTFDNSLFRSLSGASRTQLGGVYIQRDGKYMVFGSFTNLSGITGLNGLVRINNDGTYDPTFSPAAIPFLEDVRDVEQDLYQNYHIAIARGGPTYSYASTTKTGALRFSLLTNQNPSSFLPQAIACGECEVFVGGSGTYFSGSTPYNRLLKFDLNGNLNMCVYDCFSGSGANGLVTTLLVNNQNDDQVFCLGSYSTINGVSRPYVSRFQTDGQVDLTFSTTGPAAGGQYPFEGAQQSDGKLILVGNFTTWNGLSRNRLVRLNYNGSVDTSFVVGTGFSASTYFALVESDGKILISTISASYNGNPTGCLVKLNSDGTIDNTFVSSTIVANGTNIVNKIVKNADGTYYVGGNNFTMSGGRRRLILLNADGTYNPALPFNASGNGFNATVNDFEVLPDGKLIVVGDFTQYNGAATGRGMIRLNANGTKDTTFATPGYSNYQYEVITQGDKYISVGFSFAYSGIPCNQVTRINNDGTFDATWFSGDFTSPTTEDSIQHLLQLPDGFIFVGGFFNSYASNLTDNIVKLNRDGIYFDCDPVPITPTPSVTPTMTRTPAITPSNTQTATPSQTATATETSTPSVTPTSTPTIGLSPTQTPSQTETPSATPTITQTATPSQTATQTETPNVSPTQTATPSITPSPTATSGATGCLCYRLLNETGSPINYQWDDCVLGASMGSLNGGQSVQVCAVDLPVIDPGGTITPCTTVTNCSETSDCTGCS